MSIILFLAVLFVLVLVHEWGHYIAAKKTGMRVDEFAIGFPPRLFSIKKGETEFAFNALPIGGYVKIWGENKEEAGEQSEGVDYSRSFSSRPKWAQAVVLLAGVTMNILLAWVLFIVVFMLGVPTAVEEGAASESAQLFVADTLPNSPAEGVLPVGSVITSVASGEEKLSNPTPQSFGAFVTAAAPQDLVITYEDGGAELTATLTPKAGLSETEPDKYLIGTALSLVETVKKPFFTAVKDGFTTTIAGLVGISVGLFSLISDAITGTADFSTIAGPVGIVGMVGDAAAFGIGALLTFTAVISLNLAIINLLPFPALDGGRLLFVFIEAITGKDIPAKWSGWLNVAGFMLLMLLMVAVTYNDILRLL